MGTERSPWSVWAFLLAALAGGCAAPLAQAGDASAMKELPPTPGETTATAKGRPAPDAPRCGDAGRCECAAGDLMCSVRCRQEPCRLRDPFDLAYARQVLHGRAEAVKGCKRASGPTGRGRVKITFAPRGGADVVLVDAPFAGTPVAECIAYLFGGASIRPFDGPPVTVVKSFEID